MEYINHVSATSAIVKWDVPVYVLDVYRIIDLKFSQSVRQVSDVCLIAITEGEILTGCCT